MSPQGQERAPAGSAPNQAATRGAFRQLHRLRVRWAEVDLQGIVFNGHFLLYLDTAVADYWRALALPYVESMQGFGGDLYVRKSTLEYHASARYDEQLDIGIRSVRIGSSSMQFEGAVFRQDTLLVAGELVYVFADPATQKSKPVPADLRALLQGYEAGEAMHTVRTGSWQTLAADARAIRDEVFVHEQGIAAGLDVDAADATDASCLHAVAYNRIGMALATGRLQAAVSGAVKLGRMAVRQALRGAGLGSAVLESLLAAARERGDAEAMLNAPRSATGFFSRRGFTQQGPAFDVAGTPHVAMRRSLR